MIRTLNDTKGCLTVPEGKRHFFHLFVPRNIIKCPANDKLDFGAVFQEAEVNKINRRRDHNQSLGLLESFNSECVHPGAERISRQIDFCLSQFGQVPERCVDIFLFPVAVVIIPFAESHAPEVEPSVLYPCSL